MPYEGDDLNACGVLNIDCSRVAVVAVTGSGPNVCGHLILGTGAGGNDLYFHVAGINTNPKYMTASNFARYLRENGKSEIRRRLLSLPDPNGAVTYLEGLLSDTWLWGVLPHNCVAFVEDVIQAGGGTWGSYSNCPALATADTIEERANRFMGQVENEIYQLYGVPR